MAVDKDVKKIDERVWDTVKGLWLAHIPNFNHAGEAPSLVISEVIDLSNIYAITKQNQNTYTDETINIRPQILREAIYFSHKATHVCGTAIVHLNNGILSWATSSAYQSSFFALKAIFGLLGLTFQRVNHKSLMIDCFPKEEQLSKSQIKKGFLPKQEMKFCIFDDLSHMQYWEIFQRILRVTELSILDDGVKDYFLNITSSQFVEQRNNLHYTCNYWLITKDLFEKVFDNNFGVKENLIDSLNEEVNHNALDFSIFLCYLLLKLNIDLIRSLGELSEEINNEFELIIKTLNEGIHDRFHSSVNVT